MPRNVLTTQAVPGNAGLALMARIQNYTGGLLTQASVSSIAYTVTDRDNPDTALASGTFATTTVSDTLVQNDRAWTVDSASQLGEDGRHGYNWKAILPATAITVANSGKRVQIDVAFTPASGEKFRLIYRTYAEKVYG